MKSVLADTEKKGPGSIAENSPFLDRWRAATGTERANHQLFVTQLCDFLDLPQPDPAAADNDRNAYVFERRIDFHNPNGTTNRGYIDCYKRGTFIIEAKHTGRAFATGKWDDAMLRAHGQAVAYARALPQAEGRPPFVITLDVGVALEIYSEFTRSGGAYIPYPDPRSHRIRIQDLQHEAIRERLRKIWLDPLALDPTRLSARVTLDIAARLAALAKSLEQSGNGPEQTANFLMRCIFTMFAEDVGLIKDRAFTELLESIKQPQEHFAPLVQELWRTMNSGGFSATIRKQLLRFNGGLFADPSALDLDKTQLALLIDAARADWKHVEPAIFGTLLERALDPRERHKLGAHYTPRAYVERLVMPAIIDPLREEWDDTKAAALILDQQGKHQAAVEQIQAFHIRLCGLRILDPACGSGNFLYVTLEHLKRLEGEIFNALEQLGETQRLVKMQGITVDPHQFLGIETNPRAAAIAEAVIWIGYLQWHFRTLGNAAPPEPVLREFRNIENRDAVLAWDAVATDTDENGQPLTRWDGRTTRPHPVTGEQVPDENARVEVERYINPTKARWPEADYVVGNPPYLGARTVRLALGHDYLEAIRGVYKDVPDNADYVMYWWDRAAELVTEDKTKSFGFITTNSITQSFSRKVLEKHLGKKHPITIRFAIPDHPWVDSTDGAAVRVAMTVGDGSGQTGKVSRIIKETPGAEGESNITIFSQVGMVSSGLTIGVDMTSAHLLVSNGNMSCVGYQLTGKGFVVEKNQARDLDEFFGTSDAVIRPLVSGRDLTQTHRGLYAIDVFGYSMKQLRQNKPAIYQWLFDRVKPERDQNNRLSLRKNWWIFGEARSTFRPTLQDTQHAITTSLTAKHRTFALVPPDTICDSTTVMFALDDPFSFGVLSSRVHVIWALATGGRLGIGNDPRYNKTRCFETFPFPDPTDAQKSTIRDLAEQIDAHRKSRQQQHPGLTLTGIYNVLEKLRKDERLTAKEKTIHEQGIVSVLRQLHDELDRAVFDAYGWGDLAEKLVGRPGATTPWPERPDDQTAAEEKLLQRLVELNRHRAAEEKQGLVRRLRPDYQNPEGEIAAAQDQAALAVPAGPVATDQAKTPWPKTLPERVKALRAALDRYPEPATAEQLARTFRRAPSKSVAEILDTLVAMGQAREDDGKYAGV